MAPVVAELGSTTDPKALIPGKPAQVFETVQSFRRYGDALTMAGDGLATISTDGWEGEAGDSFRAVFDGEPARWIKCGDAFHAAATALDRYTSTLEWAQRQAAEAIGLWQQGEAATTQAKDDHAAATAQAQQDAATAAAAGTPTAAEPIPFIDPGAEMRAQARHLLDNARAQLQSAGDEAAAIVGQARDKAPPEPSLFGKVWEGLHEYRRGVWEGAGDLAKYAFETHPARLLVDPDGYWEAVSTRAQGALNAVQNPVEFGKAVIDLDTWKQSPARAIGHLVPDVALGVATGGAGVAAARSARVGRAVVAPAKKPEVGDKKLGNIINNLYKGVDNPQRVGDGTTADAVRHERETGTPVHGKTHSTKAYQSIRALEKWLDSNPDASPSDRQAAQQEIANLRDALGG